MNNKRLHITRLLAVLLLCVFSIALIPWGSLHHDAEQQEYCSKEGKVCMHKTHIGNERHTCLICSVHFVKDYYTSGTISLAGLQSKTLLRKYIFLSESYVALIRTSLRGPPAA